MSGQIACPDAHRAHPFQRAGGAQHIQLALDGQPVAGFDLDRPDPFGQQVIKPGQRRLDQLIDRQGVGGRNGRGNAAACARNLFIALPFQTPPELVRALAAINDMGVTVDQGRGQQTPGAIDDLVIRGKLIHRDRAHMGDPAVMQQYTGPWRQVGSPRPGKRCIDQSRRPVHGKVPPRVYGRVHGVVRIHPVCCMDE